MITECYIKGRYDFGIGKCAVVFAEEGKVIHQVAWKVPESWEYKGETIVADQYNCEILCACFAVKWCMDNCKKLINIYSNLNTCGKWYHRQEFPETRQAAAKSYNDIVAEYYKWLDGTEGNPVKEGIYAEWIPKDTDDARYAEFNYLVNQLAENLR